MGWRIKELYIESIEQLVLWEKKQTRFTNTQPNQPRKRQRQRELKVVRLGGKKGVTPDPNKILKITYSKKV